jgi:hypothetical protein
MSDMLTIRKLRQLLIRHSLDAIRPVLAAAMDEAFDRGIEEPAPKPGFNIREPPPWNTHPANKLHFVRGELVLPARNDTDDVALYLTDNGQFYLVCNTDDGLFEAKLGG